MPKKPPIQPFEARLVRIPIKDKTTTNANGDHPTLGMSLVGVRVQLENDEYFFYSTKHGSWTRHCPTAVITNRTGTNTIREEKRVTKFRDDAELRKRLGHAKLTGGQFLTYVLVNLRNEVCPKEKRFNNSK